jgi:hypothetical protein
MRLALAVVTRMILDSMFGGTSDPLSKSKVQISMTEVYYNY